MKEVEISIKGLFFYILKHWKSIIVAMLVGGVALGGLQMVKSAGKTQTSVSSEEAGASLSDSERAYVESVYDYLNELRQANEARKESLVMNLDPENVIKTELTYMISVEMPENMEGIEQAYNNYFKGSEFSGYISDKVGIDNKDIIDTVTISYERSREVALNTVIRIYIFSKDESCADNIAKAVNSYLFEKNGELLQSGYGHELTSIGSSTYRGSDLSIQTRQLQYLQEIQLRNKTILDVETALKDAQKEYYEYLSEEPSDYLVDSSDEILGTPIKAPAKLSAKYVILGLLFGAFLMCGIYFLIYIYANKLDVEDDVEAVFGTYLLGVVTGNNYGKIIYKLQHFGKRIFGFDESIRLTTTKIKMGAQKEGTSVIGVIGCGIKKHNEKVADELAEALKKDGIDAVIIDNPIYDPTSAEKLTSIERAILLEKAGITYRTEIWKEIEMIKKLDIKLDGIVISEQ